MSLSQKKEEEMEEVGVRGPNGMGIVESDKMRMFESLENYENWQSLDKALPRRLSVYFSSKG